MTFFHHPGIEAFEDVRVGFEAHSQKFLQFPLAALRGVVLELFGRAEERPLQVGWRKVDAAPVGVGVVVIQPICARAGDAAVDDKLPSSKPVPAVDWERAGFLRSK